MNKLQQELYDWASRQFGPKRFPGLLVHLEKEVAELKEVLRYPVGPDDAWKVQDELADCIMILYDLAAIFGFDVDEIIQKKFEINKKRRWGPPGPDGVVEHVRET